MKAAGIICECNPFHAGHAALLQIAREISGCDAIVCVMSGNYVQRGEIAILSASARAEILIRRGANLVIELPLPWAMSSAESFARGGVGLLSEIGVCEELVFGSESGDLNGIIRASEALNSESFRNELKTCLKEGSSFPAAREKALRNLGIEEATLLEHANDTLGIEYVRQIALQKSELCPMAVKRIEGIDGASVLRQGLLSGEDPKTLLLPDVNEVYQREAEAGRAPLSNASLEQAILYALRTLSDEEYERLPDGGEGLWMRLKAAAHHSESLQDLLEKAKTKRYTMSRIRRLALSAAAGIRAGDNNGTPPYAKVLAFDSAGRKLLRKMRDSSRIPVVMRYADVLRLPENGARIAELEERGRALWGLGLKPIAAVESGRAESARYLTR